MNREKFREARKSLGLTQRELAKKWGMGANGERSIRRWESGERPLNPIAAYCIKIMQAGVK